MNSKDTKVEKLCSFYVSDWHFVTMLLPYINQKMEENFKIITILEKDIENNIKILVEKLNLKQADKILSINWKTIVSKKYTDIEKRIKNEIGKENKNIILVNGCKDYIEKNNQNIEKYLTKHNVNVKIINFYEVTEFNNHIKEILNEHDKILNTSGEKEIEEVFEGFKKQEKIATNG